LSAARAGFRVLLEDVMPANLHHAQEILRRELGPEYFAEQLGGATEPSSGDKWMGLNPSLPAQDLSCGFMRGLKPPPPSGSSFAEEHASGAKAQIESDAIAARLKSCPDTRLSAAGVDFVSTIEDAVRDADLVIDCVPDELESKLEILWLLDRMAPPRTVLATPTTRLSIADLANCTYRPDKCVAIAAEASSLAAGLSGEILLRTTSRTSAETMELVEGFWRRLGFVPKVAVDSD
jgi:3-hydroxybutyryl-CoA dehydrogenase